MSLLRKIKRRMGREDAILGLTDRKTKLKRQRDHALRLRRTEWFMEGLMHALGHSTPTPLDAYRQRIAQAGTTIDAWNR